MRTKTSIIALIKLMCDPDEMVMEHAKLTLISYGEEIIPELERLEDSLFDTPELLEKISVVLKTLRFHRIKNSLQAWLLSPEKNLLEAIFIITSYQFPEITKQEFLDSFERLRQKCWLEISPRQTSFEKVEVLNNIFFKEYHFETVYDSALSPFNIFVNSVFESREGSDLSIGLIYSVIAQELSLPIYGVTTMNNRVPFVLAYLDKSNLLPLLDWGIDKNGVLFYIEIMNYGNIIGPQFLKESYHENGFPEGKDQFAPSPNSLLIRKYLNDIKRSYSNYSYYRYKLEDIDELLALFKY